MRRFALISLVAAWQCAALAPANRPLASPSKHVHAQRAPARALPPQAEPAPDLEAAVPDGLPATPSFKLVAFLWANTLLLAPVALAGAAMGANVLGPNWAWSAKAARQGVLFALPWIALSFAPLDKWVPAMADVTAHTELLTATALGVEFGGYRRWGQVAGATALVSASAGALEEAAFRGVAQRGVAAAVAWLLRLGRAATAGPVDRVATAVAVGVVAGGFGALHDYCRGYALLAALAGAYFGVVYACTGNLLVAAVAHAAVDAVAFVTCYWSLCRRSAADKAKLAARSFKVTDALRATRARLEAA